METRSANLSSDNTATQPGPEELAAANSEMRQLRADIRGFSNDYSPEVLDKLSLPELRAILCGLDFIGSYVAWADVLEAPRAHHEAVATQLVASLLNRNVVIIRFGSETLTMDFWQVLLSGSGVGRNTLIRASRELLDAAGLRDLVKDANWGSPQALYQDFAENRHALQIFPEIATYLKQLCDPQFSRAKEWIADRYDESRCPDAITFRRTGKRIDTPPIVFDCAPRRNLLASSSKAWFFENITNLDSEGGFIPRWAIVLLKDDEEQKRVVPIPGPRDPELRGRLVDYLRYLEKLQGEPDLAEILDSYARWYVETMQRFANQSNKALGMAFFRRHRGHILKLAVAYEASSSLTLKVSVSSWRRAVETARRLENTISTLLRSGLSREGAAINTMEEEVRRTRAEGLLRSAFTRRFQDVPERERRSRLVTLQSAELISVFIKRGSRGQPPTRYVHTDYVNEFEQKNPGWQRSGQVED